MIGFFVLGLLAFVLFSVAIMGSRWAGKKGWVYNKHNPRPTRSGMPMMLDEIFQPSVSHVIEEQSSEAIRADQRESGDKPKTE